MVELALHRAGRESGDELAVLRGHSEKIQSMIELNDCDRLVSGAEDRTIRLWSLDTLEEVAELRGHRDAVHAIVATPDGRTLFSASGDYTIRRWGTRPPRDLLTALMEYEEIATRLAPHIAALFAQLDDATAAADSVEADETLSERERQIALQLVLRESVSRARIDSLTDTTKVSE